MQLIHDTNFFLQLVKAVFDFNEPNMKCYVSSEHHLFRSRHQ